MNVEDIMLQYAPAYCKTWPEAFEAILSNPVEKERVGFLREILRRDGSFQEPVCLDAEDLRVANGMHRILAHREESAAEVKVSYEPLDVSNLEEIEVVLSYKAEPGSDFLDDTLVDAVKSFPVGTDWAEADFFSGHQKAREIQLTGFWYWSADRIPELTSALVERAARWGFQVEVASAKVADAWS